MSLDPKDVRLKLDPEVHQGLEALADLKGLGIAELGERIIAEYVARRLHEATLLVDKCGRLGISRKAWAPTGKPGGLEK